MMATGRHADHNPEVAGKEALRRTIDIDASITFQSLTGYGRFDVSFEIANRWLTSNCKVVRLISRAPRLTITADFSTTTTSNQEDSYVRTP
jgi:hypothetical protein